MHQDPHQLIEGMTISCFAVGAKLAYIYIREEFPEAAITLERAISEAKAKGAGAGWCPACAAAARPDCTA